MKTFLFDLDGTLVDSAHDLRASFNKMAKRFGYQPYTLEQVKGAVGHGIRQAVKNLIGKPLSEQELDERVDYFNSEYKRNSVVLTKPFCGIIELINELKKRGCKVAVVTNKLKSNSEIIINKLFGECTFDLIYGNGKGAYLKPDRRCVDAVIQALNAPRERVCMVGDMLADLQVSKNAGIEHIIVEWGYGDKNQLIKAGASNFVQKPLDILNNFL